MTLQTWEEAGVVVVAAGLHSLKETEEVVLHSCKVGLSALHSL